MPEPRFVLTGERAALGLLRRDQLAQLAAWFNDPEVRRGLAHRGVVNVDGETAWYEEMTKAGTDPRPTVRVWRSATAPTATGRPATSAARPG